MLEVAGGKAIAVAADVMNKADLDALVAATMQKLGRIDHVVNNAGKGNIINISSGAGHIGIRGMLVDRLMADTQLPAAFEPKPSGNLACYV